MDEDMERRLLHHDLNRERDSDEDGGAKTRVEFDSDFSYDSDTMAPVDMVSRGIYVWVDYVDYVVDRLVP